MHFNGQVYKRCRKIPVGRVTTYKLLAEALGSEAYRVVGNALHKNQHAPEVPCHRIINTGGDLGGFVFGGKKKKQMRGKEGIKIVKNKVADWEKVLFKF